MLVTWNEQGPPSAAVRTRVLAPHGHGTVGASAIFRTTGAGMADLGRRLFLVYCNAAVLAFFTGCEPASFVPPHVTTPVESRSWFASWPGPPGRITGRVGWTDPVPALPPFRAVKGVGSAARTHEVPHPFAPQVDPNTRGLAGAVVFLRGVDPLRSKPWDRSAVSVEIVDDEFRTHDGRVGFVPVGAEATFVSRSPVLQLVRGRGDDFF